MGSRYFQRPENAISKADEFIKVGKPIRALDTLYDVIKSKKRNHSFSEKLMEQIMFKYLELCVDLKKSHAAKEGLFQYRNLCQSTNVASLAAVVQGYLSMAEKRTESARQESVESVQDVDDLDNLATPEMIMLSAVSGEDAQDRSDRKILMPWVKFLWESYCQCLELLRTNVRVERLYHDIAQQAFRFCLKYSRKTEFRKLCEKLRTHLDLALRQVTPSVMTINLNNADTQQMNLETRLGQLDSAIQMELWQEAYKAVEDIHGLMVMSKKVYQPKVMANYYQKLALVFWKSGNHLFHAAAIFKHFQLTREMKKNLSPDELGRMASRVLASCLAIPIPSHHPEFDKFIETDRTPQEKMARLAGLLSLQQPPTRQSLIKDASRFGIVQASTAPMQDLYQWLEVEFHPLKLCNRVQSILNFIEGNEEMSQLQQYLPSLREITLVRLMKQVAQVYQSILIDRLLHLAPFASQFLLERVILDCVRHNDMQARIDHCSKTVHFGTDLTEAQSYNMTEGPHLQDMPSEQVRTQLMTMVEVLDKSLKTIHPDKFKVENNALRQKIVEAYRNSRVRDHERILARHKMIEERKEYLEKLSIHREAEEQRKLEQQLREQQKKEEDRLRADREVRERQKQEERVREIKQRQFEETVKTIAQTDIGKKVLSKMDEKDIAGLDMEQIVRDELENEKRQLIARLKAQEKRVDHFERAKRKEEIPLLKEEIKKDEEEDRLIWKAKEEERIKKSILEREAAVKTRDRLLRMKEDKDAFMNTLLQQRAAHFQSKLKEYQKKVQETRVIRLQERKRQRKEERKQKWFKAKEEEEQRLRDEAIKREREEKAKLEELRLKKEAEEYRIRRERLDAIAAMQAERTREIERKEELRLEEARREKKIESRSTEDESRDWRSENRDESIRRGRDSKDQDDATSKAWRPGTGNWRDRERQKKEEWGPRRGDTDERQPRWADDNEERPVRRAADDERPVRKTEEDRPSRGGDEDRSFRRDDDRPPRRADDKTTIRRQDDRPFRRDDDRPVRRDEDRSFRRDDDRPIRRDDDRSFRREDDRSFRRDDDRPLRRDDDRPIRRDEDRSFRRDEDRPFRREDDRPFRRDDDRSFRRDDDRPLRRDDDRSFGKDDDRPIRRDDDRSFRRDDDRPPRGGGDRRDRGERRFERGGDDRGGWRTEGGPDRDRRDGGGRPAAGARRDDVGNWRSAPRPAAPREDKAAPAPSSRSGAANDDSNDAEGWQTVKR